MNRLDRWEKAELIECGCGCGGKIKPFDKWGRTRKYICGHAKKPFSSHNRYNDNTMIKCSCGCGKEINAFDKRGRPVKRIYGHVANKIYYSVAEQRREWRKRNFQKCQNDEASWKKQRKVALIKMKGGECHQCHLKYDGKNGGLFQFHHIDISKKKFNVCLNKMNKAWTIILAEVEKCLLLCSNCHRLKHSCEF